jgi:hypothetical protein
MKRFLDLFAFRLASYPDRRAAQLTVPGQFPHPEVSTMRPKCRPVALLAALLCCAATLRAGEPDPKSYWEVKDIKAGMTGTGKTVMVGTKLEEFGAEVLGVMRDVSPGRDMVLCRLTGCNLEHAGIIQGMSGSPIYVQGKLLGAVAFAWEFAKDPIAGVTPFGQTVQYVRSNDRRIAAEALAKERAVVRAAWVELPIDPAADLTPVRAAGASLAGMRPIATPLATSGFGPRALALLQERLGPLGLAPMAGGAAQEEIVKAEGDKPLVPGAPLSVAMVTGDFDISGIGTVTHVEGDRVYGFGHPMFGLGACEFPLMTGYIHTIYPRASVSMKMGSPLKVVGVIDTDVSTGIAGRIGPKPDLLPLTVKVKTGTYAEPRTYKVQSVREPTLLATLVMSVLTNAIDTEGNLPEELTAHLTTTINVKGHEPIVFRDTLSGPRYSGPMGPAMLFGPVGTLVNILVRNPLGPARIESIDAEVAIESGRTSAEIESIRLASDRLEPGESLKALATLKPFHSERQTVEVVLPLPPDLLEGTHEVVVCDSTSSFRRRVRNEPSLVEPRDVAAILRLLRFQTELKRTTLYLHVPAPDRGLAVQGQELPNLPGSVRAVFAGARQTPSSAIRADYVATTDTPWVIEGSHTLKFTVVKDANLAR